MYRVLLPDGELTLTSRVVPIHLEYNKELGYTGFRVVSVSADANALYVSLKEPDTNHKGVLIHDLVNSQINEIFDSFLRNGYCDLSAFADIDKCESISTKEFNDLVDIY